MFKEQAPPEAKYYAYTDASSADLSFYESLQYIGYVKSEHINI